MQSEADTKRLIYKICPEALWRQTEASGSFSGAPIDEQDGFIHFSTAAQLRETAAKHFAGQKDLLLVAVDEALVASMLRYEISRGGDKFPHLYDLLPLTAVVWVKPLPIAEDGSHVFPEGL